VPAMTMRKEFGPMGARLRSEHGASEVPPSTHMDDYRVNQDLGTHSRKILFALEWWIAIPSIVNVLSILTMT